MSFKIERDIENGTVRISILRMESANLTGVFIGNDVAINYFIIRI